MPSEPSTKRKIQPYGSWPSPISSDMVSAGQVRLGEMSLSGETLYWTESRPKEEGRSVLIRCALNSHPNELTSSTFNVRSRVHEYGGGSILAAEDTVYFSNLSDHRLYRLESATTTPLPISAPGNIRYADGTLDTRRRRLITVAENHELSSSDPVGSLIALDIDGTHPPQTLVSGSDFYSSPSLSPDGNHIAWLSWNHPSMPWDGTELWIARVELNGSLTHAERIAGGKEESIFQPSWAPDGRLHFVSDKTGWWNLYAHQSGTNKPLIAIEAEFGRPQWVFGNPTYGFENAEHLICSYVKSGIWYLGRLNSSTGTLEKIPLPYTEIRHVHVSRSYVYFQGGSPSESMAIVRLDLSDGSRKILARTNTTHIDQNHLSIPRQLTFPTTHNKEAHGFFYPPTNHKFSAPSDELPPLIVVSHGGPTGSSTTTLNLDFQFWTSRGFALLDVNYRGSTGYGRGYREDLKHQWGLVDVDDCEFGANYLVEQGYADSKRLAIRGASAGGYTTLMALTFRDTFTVGASHYGVSDLEALLQKTHKFESRYLEHLIGSYPDKRKTYFQRSPVHAAEQLSRPIIFFQGLDDPIVPPDQARCMVEILHKKGLTVASLEFSGEQHGFRKATTIRHVIEAELYFYACILGLKVDSKIEPIEIKNFKNQPKKVR